jgi:hypothetical protein
VPGVSEEAFRAFYDRYVSAHVKAGGAPPRVTADQLRQKLGAETARILAEKKCARVDLDVEIEGGKVKLKAKPIR